MPPRSTAEIRTAYLEFFKKHGHSVIPSASLIPENDPTVLFTTAGMHPLVPYLLGEEHPAGKRLTDVQRCIRTQDIDEVGDASHLTFFEMLGNWSLGDYFKKEAIEMSYEFLTEVLGIDRDYIAVSCFGGDDKFPEVPRDKEAWDIWKSVGVAEERIGFIKGGMVESDHNWWGPAGATGPCGPDTEMFYWIGEGTPQGNPASHPNMWLEIWNDVFMQYNKQEDGSFSKLAQQNVDTGMGLERTAQVLQGVGNVYEIDVMQPLLQSVQDRAVKHDVRHERIVVDHLRAASFIIADGIQPGNTDQGYVLRKLIRRAIRSGRQLGIEEAFCAQISEAVVGQYSKAYPHLSKADAATVLLGEEEKFGSTLREGLKHFEKTVQELSGTQIAGTAAFHLYDTYGFPLELTREMAKERKLSVDEEDFVQAFKQHQETSRAGASQRFAGGLADHSAETTRLHTATHLLNAALRTVLGDHVFQKGSNITKERLRFDFSHSDKLTSDQLREVEHLVNEKIKENLPVDYHMATPQQAKEEGAIGVFDERYDSEVKVYSIGDGSFSKEICGGPHVERTGELGTFKIKKEESSSAGVRRIKAVLLALCLMCVPLQSEAKSNRLFEKWLLKTEANLEEWNYGGVDEGELTSEGIKFDVEGQAVFFRPLPQGFHDHVDAIRVFYGGRPGLSSVTMMLISLDEFGEILHRFRMEFEAKQGATTLHLPLVFYEHEIGSPHLLAVHFDGEAEGVTFEGVRFLHYSTAEKLINRWKSFWTLQPFKPHTINIVLGPAITTDIESLEEFVDWPLYATSVNAYVFLGLILFGIGLLFWAMQKATPWPLLRSMLLKRFFLVTLIVWLVWDFRMGWEFLTAVAQDHVQYITAEPHVRTFRDRDHFYDFAQFVKSLVQDRKGYELIAIDKWPYHGSLRYFTYPSLPNPDDPRHDTFVIYKRSDVWVDKDGHLVGERVGPITAPGTVLGRFSDDSFVFRISPS